MPTKNRDAKAMHGNHCIELQDLASAYASLTLFASGPLAGRGTELDCGDRGARFRVDCDLAPLFPYINTVMEGAVFQDKPVSIKFLFASRLCVLLPDEGAFAPVRDRAEAYDILAQLFAFVVDIARSRAKIPPNFKRFKPSSALDIFRLLPGTNCGACGFTTCIAFAAALSRQRSSMTRCPHLAPPMEETAVYPVFDAQGNLASTVSLHIDTQDFRQDLDRKDSRIRELQSRLAAYERQATRDLQTANSRLPEPLTQRELQVLGLIVRGATNREISGTLAISPHTVKSHVTHIFHKIGVNDRAQAAAWGACHGMR